MLRAKELIGMHDRMAAEWHAVIPRDESLMQNDAETLLLRQHLANFELWHEEDEARAPGANDAAIARVKRAIDLLNQRRHDVTEALDSLLLEQLQGGAGWNGDAPLHSETPGMMADRLSILALKMHHTREEVHRKNAPAGHAENNQARFQVLGRQRNDLAACFDSLLDECTAGRRRFALYRQLKMYNDPALNPAVYNAEARGS